MTCIVGIEAEDGRVIIGADSAGTEGWDLVIRADEKVFTRRIGYVDFAFGFTSSFRMGQLLRYSGTRGDWSRSLLNDDTDAFMATEFVDWVRATLKDGGYARADNGTETGGTFLVGVAGRRRTRLYTVCDDYQVARAASGFAAAGCGRQVALGAMYASSGTAAERIDAALAAAEALNAGVRGPFRAVTLGARPCD